MADKRELILQRLEQVSAGVPGIAATARNRGLLRNEQRPAIVVLDGDETTASTGGDSRGRARMTPQVVRMRPEIYILPREARPTGEDDKGEDPGTVANDYRMLLLQAIAADEQIRQLIGPNGGIVYQGMVTDLHSGGYLAGEARLDLSISYVLDVA